MQPGSKLGKYEILQWLGGGAAGTVWLAKDTTLNKNVALKTIETHPDNRQETLKEAQILDRLNHPAPHPHIVRFHTASIEPPYVVLDMEYIKGQTLSRLLEAEESLSLERSIEIAAHVLDALAFARTKHICHRDIKPANILIGTDGCVMLTDFGIADHLDTKSVMVGGGSPAYMAPEVFAPTPQMDYQSDVWSVGVVLYEMLSGQRPFKPSKGTPECTTQARWQEAITTQTPRPITTFVLDAPPALQIVLNRALAVKKSERFPSAQEFYDTLVRTRLYNPPLTKEEMERERHFRQVFASIEKWMDNAVQPVQVIGFKDVVREYARQNPAWSDTDELLRLANIRNRFSHELTQENERRLLPTLADIALIERINTALVSTLPERSPSTTTTVNPITTCKPKPLEVKANLVNESAQQPVASAATLPVQPVNNDNSEPEIAKVDHVAVSVQIAAEQSSRSKQTSQRQAKSPERVEQTAKPQPVRDRKPLSQPKAVRTRLRRFLFSTSILCTFCALVWFTMSMVASKQRQHRFDQILADAVKRNDVNGVRDALHQGANPNGLDKEGQSIFGISQESYDISVDQANSTMEAAGDTKRYEYYNSAIMQAMLDARADVSKSTFDGTLPFITSVRFESPGTVQCFLNHGCRINSRGNTSFVNSDVDKGEMISGLTAVHAATVRKDTAVLKLLLENNVYINVQNKLDKNYIKFHCGYNVEYQKLPDGVTALMLAAGNKRNTALKMLLGYGADTNLVDNKGRTALTYAKLAHNDIGVQLLKNAGARL